MVVGCPADPAAVGGFAAAVGAVAEDADTRPEHLQRQRLGQVLELAAAEPGQVVVHVLHPASCRDGITDSQDGWGGQPALDGVAALVLRLTHRLINVRVK